MYWVGVLHYSIIRAVRFSRLRVSHSVIVGLLGGGSMRANRLSRFMLSHWAMGVLVCILPLGGGCFSLRWLRAVVGCICGWLPCVLESVMCGVFMSVVWAMSVGSLRIIGGGALWGLSLEEVISWAIFLFLRNAVINLISLHSGDVLRIFFHSLTVCWAQGEYVIMMGRVGPVGGVFL